MIDFHLFQNKEKYLILEVGEKSTSGFLLRLDPDKEIILEKTWSNFFWTKISRRFRRHLEKWKVIVVANPSLATTIVLPIKLEREDNFAKSPLSSIELENLLAQATAKVFTQVRGEASRDLGIEELDTILIDNRVCNFKIDCHHVMNPVDFRAKKIDAVLELTLTTRTIFDDWKTNFSIGETKNFFFTEAARAELFLLKKLKPLPINLLIFNSRQNSQFSKLEKAAVGELIHRGKIKWATNSIINAIEQDLSVSPAVAQKLYSLYSQKKLSPRITRHFNLILKPAIVPFLKHLEELKVRGAVYLDTSLPLPPFLSHKQGHATLENLPFDDLINKLGFKIDSSKYPWPENQIFKHLAPFLEFYYNNEDLAINHWLRRRLHWLGSVR